jgi:hypothetical protein
MSRLLAIIAATLPTSVEFHIQYVVPIFQMSTDKKVYPKKWSFLVTLLAIISRGTHATNKRRANQKTGHATTSNRPVKIL